MSHGVSKPSSHIWGKDAEFEYSHLGISNNFVQLFLMHHFCIAIYSDGGRCWLLSGYIYTNMHFQGPWSTQRVQELQPNLAAPCTTPLHRHGATVGLHCHGATKSSRGPSQLVQAPMSSLWPLRIIFQSGKVLPAPGQRRAASSRLLQRCRLQSEERHCPGQRARWPLEGSCGGYGGGSAVPLLLRAHWW